MESTDQKKLFMSFDPNTIDHLGIKMYSQLPNAMAELIANAYDACAKKVEIRLFDENDKSIEVHDNGTGMTFDELNRKFLRIGRNRRDTGDNSSECDRVPTGKKGLGKLAFFGIANTIAISTERNGQRTIFNMVWTDLKATEDGHNYEPRFKIEECSKESHGTVIILTDLKRKSNFDSVGLASSLGKLFNFHDSNFVLELSHNGGKPITIDNKMKYSEIKDEFSWKFPLWIDDEEKKYDNELDIKGKIVSTEKPLPPGLRGITLFANGRMVNKPEFFGMSESSHFFSYLTGWLDIDFIDNLEIDVISTNRQSLDWDQEATTELRTYLRLIISKIHIDWRDKRKEKRKANISQKTQIDVGHWFNTLPREVEIKVSAIISKLVEDSELPESDSNQVVKDIYALIPEYPYYHWRHLNQIIQDASKDDYIKKDYYRAFQEAAKRYISCIRIKSGDSTSGEYSLVSSVFGDGKLLSVTKNYKKPDGSKFQSDTIVNIEEGQKFLSMGIVKGGRNPVSHEEIFDLRESGLFTEDDCLDGLSLLSHLTRRLDDT